MARSEDILTERLRLIPFDEKCISSRYLGWLNDRHLMQYSEQRHRVHTRESCLQYLDSFDGSPHYFWAIVDQPQSHGHIGNINAYIDEKNLLADMGIVIGERSAQGQGYALEAWLAVCRFLFTVTESRKITAGTMACNVAMLQLMQRAGMVPDGVRKRHYLLSGEEIDIQHMALFRDDWSKRQGEMV